jgi:hypothetical protein
VPVSATGLTRAMTREASLAGWHMSETHRTTSGFYISEALRLLPPEA